MYYIIAECRKINEGDELHHIKTAAILYNVYGQLWPHAQMKCNLEGCNSVEKASFRCSKCKCRYYCSPEHQRLDWKEHKKFCVTSSEDSTVKSDDSSTGRSTSVESSNESSKRISRCMFCGESLVLTSEEDAVDHMRVCIALQEQLNGKEQFIIPTFLKEKIKSTDEKVD